MIIHTWQCEHFNIGIQLSRSRFSGLIKWNFFFLVIKFVSSNFSMRYETNFLRDQFMFAISIWQMIVRMEKKLMMMLASNRNGKRDEKEVISSFVWRQWNQWTSQDFWSGPLIFKRMSYNSNRLVVRKLRNLRIFALFYHNNTANDFRFDPMIVCLVEGNLIEWPAEIADY